MTGRRPSSAPRPPMSDAHHAAITLELVRLVLGGRPERAELRDRIEAEHLARRRLTQMTRRSR